MEGKTFVGKTSKREKELHGIGMKSVKDIVEEYDGQINIRQSDDEVEVIVVLPAKE